jgi:hypothetical protein
MYAGTHISTTGGGPNSTKKFEDFWEDFFRELGEWALMAY